MKKLEQSLAGWQHESKTHFYIQPHKLLRKWIAHYTVTLPRKMPESCVAMEWKAAEELSGELEIVPDASGCIVMTFEQNDWGIFLWGPTTKLVTVKKDFDRVPVRFFVEFMPGGLYQMTSLNPAELRNRSVSLQDAAPEIARELSELLEKSGSIEDVLARLDYCFLDKLNESGSALLPYLLEEIGSREGAVTVQELADLSGYSRRHLARLVSFDLGVSLKQYVKVMRINRSLILIKKARDEELTQVGQELGYFDQSHFIHDFRSVCGVSPGEYLKNMSRFYNETFKF